MGDIIKQLGKRYSVLIILIFAAGIISYGVHFFSNYYKYFQIVISFLLILLLMLFFRYENEPKKQVKSIIYKQKYIFVMFFMMILSTLFGFAFKSYNNLMSIVSTILFAITAVSEFYILPSIFINYESVEKKVVNFYIIISVVLSLISIGIKINNGSFLGYGLLNVRVASVFRDPNFAAMLFGTAFLLVFGNTEIKNKLLKIVALIIIGIAILLTGSRGTLLSVILAIFLYIVFYKKINIIFKILGILCFSVIAFFLLKYLYSVNFFRVYQGSNDRIEMWTLAINAILISPIFGYGYQSISGFLGQNGLVYASTHNSYIDFAFAYGIPCFILYIILIVTILIRSIKNKNYDENKNKYILLMLFSIIDANTILYSFGGVGISSLIFTLSLGVVNYKIKCESDGRLINEKNKHNSSNI